jgi:hypothetical protein
MSMLTPPGMGGQYRIKGDRYPRMRRPRNRRRIVLASVAAATVLGVLGWGTVQLVDVFTGGGDRVRASEKSGGQCADTADSAADRTGTTGPEGAGKDAKGGAGALPEPGKIKVNVLNATSRTGLAAKTAKALKKRGFAIGEVTNAPAGLDKKVKRTGLLIGATGEGTADRFTVLGTHLDGAGTRHDERKSDDIDLVIGDKFTALDSVKAADKALAALTAPSPGPSPRC